MHYTTRGGATAGRAAGCRGCREARSIPLGVDDELFAGTTRTNASPYVLALCRLDPKKGIDLLIHAFHDVVKRRHRRRLASRHRGRRRCRLRRASCGQRQRPAQARSRIVFEGWVSGDARFSLLRHATLFALLSSQENFGVALVEALACGMPAIVSPGGQSGGRHRNEPGGLDRAARPAASCRGAGPGDARSRGARRPPRPRPRVRRTVPLGLGGGDADRVVRGHSVEPRRDQPPSRDGRAKRPIARGRARGRSADMCGIAGALFWNSEAGAVAARPPSRGMVHALAHRGPDGAGVVRCVTEERAGSEAADRDSRSSPAGDHRSERSRAVSRWRVRAAPIWLTYNGEIYNFAMCGASSKRVAGRSDPNSDTEVILQGYEEWGAAVVERLRGMFAFALWDGAAQRLWLARDRLGIKPLYVYRGNGYLVFASEIRALLASGLVPRTLDRAALDQFLAYQSVPEPRTLVAGRPDARTRPPRPGRRGRPRSRAAVLGFAGRGGKRRSRSRRTKAVGAFAICSRSRPRCTSSATCRSACFCPAASIPARSPRSCAQAGVVPRTFAVAFPARTTTSRGTRASMAKSLQTDHTEISLRRGRRPGADSGRAGERRPSERRRHQHVRHLARGARGGHQGRAVRPRRRRVLRRLSVVPPAAAGRGDGGRVAALAERWCGASPAAPCAARRIVGRLGQDGGACSKPTASLPQTFPILRQLFSDGTAARRCWVRRRLRDVAPPGDPYVYLLQRDARSRSGSGSDVARLVR